MPRPARLAGALAENSCSYGAGRQPSPMTSMANGEAGARSITAGKAITGGATWGRNQPCRSVPEPIGDFARDHGAGLHHHLVTRRVDMAEKPRPGAMRGPVGIAAIFAGIEAERPHVLGPMGLGLHHHGDAVARLLPGQRSL